jgi:hypothetical protein
MHRPGTTPYQPIIPILAREELVVLTSQSHSGILTTVDLLWYCLVLCKACHSHAAYVVRVIVCDIIVCDVVVCEYYYCT